MRTFLLKDKIPICKWGQLPPNTYFIGNIPNGYTLAASPSSPYIVLDVDKKEGKNGFDYIDINVLNELNKTFNYTTKHGGRHFWLKYTGNKSLVNRATPYGIDLRTEKGYVAFYSKRDIRDCIPEMKETNLIINNFLEEFFTHEIRDRYRGK